MWNVNPPSFAKVITLTNMLNEAQLTIVSHNLSESATVVTALQPAARWV